MNWRDKYERIFTGNGASIPGLNPGIIRDIELPLTPEQAEAEERFYLLLHSGDKEYLAQQRIGWRL